ncbi:unnamed protein product [Cuscuta campestris]|uniref:RING-type E3 ubiquitin transferase n=1 Tax=Cuscuta campestris TaxID=132261 RepID=A0A484MEI9_9ASTE|nr:unnamed protein product [Cuscuta campestris]
MSAVVSGDSTELNGRYRKPKILNHPKPIPEIDPNPLLISPNRPKPTISSLLLAPFSPAVATTDPTTAATPKKKNFTSFRRLGCAASSQVSVPAVIRSSADWDSKRVKKKKQRCKLYSVSAAGGGAGGGKVSVPGNPPAAVGFVTSRRPALGRRKVDDDTVRPRERSACSLRRMVIPEDDPYPTFELPRSRTGIFGSRHHRYSPCGFTEGFSEVLMMQSTLMGGGLEGHDRYRDWRLDVDDMSYEDLLELGDRIGHVSTGLREDVIDRHVSKTKPKFPSHFSTETERKCSICQEEYESGDEMGKLECGHLYHIHCIKQWLQHKNACPVCKSAAAATSTHKV